MRLSSNSLFSKWGFCDGDIISEWLSEYDYKHTEGFKHPKMPEIDEDHHRLLERLINKYLIPKIPNKLELEFICTNHNPVRCIGIDGKELPNNVHYNLDYKPPFDIDVYISENDVLETIKEKCSGPDHGRRK